MSAVTTISTTNTVQIEDKMEEEEAILDVDLNSNISSEIDKVLADETPQSKDLPEPESDEWIIPDRIKKDYLIYRAGYDLEGRPIWIVDALGWDFKKLVSTEEEKELFQKYLKRVIRATVKSIDDKSTAEKPVSGAVIILDARNFKMATLLNISAVSFVLSICRKYKHLLGYVSGVTVINANGFAVTAINIVKPILGKFMEKAEVLGFNKDKWVPKLLKNIDPTQLPQAYGGTNKDFKPIYDWD